MTTAGGAWTIGPMRIHDVGDPSRPPLVLLHGLASSSRCWSRTVPALERRHRILLVDLFAGGTARFGLADAAGQLADDLASRGVTLVSLVGHSMGGLVALHLAASSPGLVAKLVLVAAPAVRLPRRRIEQVAAVARSSVSSGASAVGLVLGSVVRTNPLCLLAATRVTMAADLGSEAASASVPTLLAWGTNDRIVPVAIGQRLAREMPSAELLLIPGAGHQPMWERPEPFNAALAEFLSR